MSDAKAQLMSSKTIPAAMKPIIGQYVISSSRYIKGLIVGLRKPDNMTMISSKISGVSFGADKDGFFVYTHRSRSKSHKDPFKITKKEIDSVERNV